MRNEVGEVDVGCGHQAVVAQDFLRRFNDFDGGRIAKFQHPRVTQIRCFISQYGFRVGIYQSLARTKDMPLFRAVCTQAGHIRAVTSTDYNAVFFVSNNARRFF